MVELFRLWLPSIEPKNQDKFVKTFLSNQDSKWKYLQADYKQSDPRKIGGSYRLPHDTSIARHVFIYLKRYNSTAEEDSPYLMDTFKLNSADNQSSISSCYLEYGSGHFYPHSRYYINQSSRIYQNLLSYVYRKHDYNSGTQVDYDKFNTIYPIMYFNLENQGDGEDLPNKRLDFTYTLNKASTENFTINAIILYEKDNIW